MNNLLSSIRGFDSDSLTPTTTVEHNDIQIHSNEQPKVGHDSNEEIKEFFDSIESTKAQVKELADLIKAAKHVVVYTGAGISTAAKIPDYRGPSGVWTLKDRGLSSAGAGVTIAQAVPTFAHMALSLLYNKGLIKYVVSTNVDGLHRRSGLPVQGLAELHGNCYKEICNKCGHEYLRDFDCTSRGCRKDHLTGRDCEKCTDGKLLDSIIHFGENLPDSELTPAITNAQQADLALVLGTSMKVSPACNLPAQCFKNKGKLVICNLQKTPFDSKANMIMHVPTDIVMQYLLDALHLSNELPDVGPEGFPIIRPEEYNPEQLKNKSDQQMTQLSTSTSASTSTSTAPRRINVNLALPPRPFGQVTGKKGETSIVESEKDKILFIRDCSDCNLTVRDPSVKIVIENIQSTTVTINGMILTGTCEIISCKGSTIIFNHHVPTITIDKSQDCTVAFTGRESVQFIWADCQRLKLRVSMTEYKIPEAKDLKSDIDLDITQFKTTWKMGQVKNELIIREGAGYATTEQEKRINDERDRRNEALFAQAMSSLSIAQPKGPSAGR